MKSFIVLSVVAAAALGASHRTRRAAFQFADGVDDVVGEVRTTFQCPERYGYFADVDNDCKVFHICNPIRNSEGAIEQVDHYSFFCGNQTVFNQLTLTCAHPEEAVPCPNAPDFFYVNDNIGKEEAAFLTDADVQRGAALYPGYAQPTPDAAPAQAAATNQYYYTVPHPKAQQMYSAYDNYPTYPVHPTTSRRDQQVYVSGPQDSHRPEISRRASAAFGQRIRK